MSDPLSTRFLPAGRSSAEELRAQAARLATSPVVTALFQAAGGAVAVLNAHRQIVALNQPYLDLLGGGAGDALGLRPGEAIGCTRAADGPDGCGTGAGCAGCGTALALVVAERRDRPEERDCAITVRRGDRRTDLDLRVRAAPLDLDGERFTLLSVTDVSADRRRQLLERAFGDDLSKQVAALRAAAALLAEPSPPPEALARVRHQIQHVERSLQLQRALTAGVGGRVEPAPRAVGVADELRQLALVAEASSAAKGKRIDLLPVPDGEMMIVDPGLLQHVLVAMVLNALEATRPGGAVRVTAESSEALVTFAVWNAGAIPATVQHRIFQRYFTTRGPGRGNGTWSMKVVGEELMRGEVGFRSSAGGGTTFWLTVPRRPFAVA